MLQRGIQHFSDDIKVTVEVKGIYGLPDEWSSKIDEPGEQAFQYEVKVLGTHLKGGKLMPKEDPEDSQAPADSSVKKADATKKKGKADEPEELTPEEEEKLKKEKEERETLNAQLQDQWGKMTDDDRFY